MPVYVVRCCYYQLLQTTYTFVWLEPGVFSFAEDIVLRDVGRLLKDSEINPCGPSEATCSSHNSSSLGYASRSRDCTYTARLGFLQKYASYLEDDSFTSSGLEVVNRNYSRGVRFVIKG